MKEKIDNNVVLRDYLLREISNNNKTLNGMMVSAFKSYRDSFNKFYRELLKSFAGDNSPMLDEIYRDIRENHPSYSPYHYFDINTLFAYKTFQEKVIELADNYAYARGRKGINSRELLAGLKDAGFWLRDVDIPKKEKGYYNGSIGAIKKINKNGKKELSPRKPLSNQEFQKRYAGINCKSLLKNYFEGKDGDEKIDENELYEKISYKYNGKNFELRVQEKINYLNEKGEGIIAIRAVGDEGSLFVTYNLQGGIYEGDLYDIDGNLYEVGGGGEYFYPNKPSSEIQNGVSETTCETSKTKKEFLAQTFDDDDQITLI